MLFIKKFFFSKKTYPIFFENLKIAKTNQNAVILMYVEKDILTIMFLVNFKAIIFKKQKDSFMLMENITFFEKTSELTEEILELILKTKEQAITCKSYAVIENLSEIINKVKISFNLSVEQQQQIWKEVLNLDESFFQSGEKLKLPEGNSNKWID